MPWLSLLAEACHPLANTGAAAAAVLLLVESSLLAARELRDAARKNMVKVVVNKESSAEIALTHEALRVRLYSSALPALPTHVKENDNSRSIYRVFSWTASECVHFI